MNIYIRAFNSMIRSLPPWGVALLIFVAVVCFVFGIFTLFSAFKKKPTPEELKKREIELAEEEAVVHLTQNDKRNSFDRWFADLLEEGNSKIAPAVAMLLVMGMMLLTGGCMFIITENVLLALGTGTICMVFPIFYWLGRRSWRISRMKAHLPETLEAIGDAIRGGLSLEEAMEMTSNQIEEPLKTEFVYANRQLNLGQTPTWVMDRMARRIPIPEFRIFTTAVLVHRTTGGNLAFLAERLAHSARERAEFRGHLKAISAGSRMSIIGLVVVTIMAIMILTGLDYSYLYKFIMNPYGPTLLGITAGLFIIGGFWAWRIMRVNY